MPLNVRVLFGRPQSEIASLLRDRMHRCSAASIVVGFATPEGLQAIAPALLAQPGRLSALVLGAGTYKGFETLDRLLAGGVQPDCLLVHLGHTRPLGARSVHRYHPMLHSKIYYLELPNGDACAFIGSHNLSGFALLGLNGEASVLLEGPASDPEFQKVREHINEARRQAIQYDPAMKDAFTWWSGEFMNGMWRKVNDEPDDAENERTIVILSAESAGGIPASGEMLYFEVPEALPIKTLASEVHVFVFGTLPPSPSAALETLDQAKASLWCKTRGLEEKRGGRELQADWEIVNRRAPVLRRTAQPFRPTITPDMRQVRAEVYRSVRTRYEYLFGRGDVDWRPVLSQDERIAPSPEESAFLRSLELNPPEDGEWQLVRGFELAEPKGTQRYQNALRESSPESGSYVLISRKRRERVEGSPRHPHTQDEKR